MNNLKCRKKPFSARVVIIMDSNRRHIDRKKFWQGKKVGIFKAGTAIEAAKVLDNTDFKGVQHIILHVGTNDVEAQVSAEVVCNNIIAVSKRIKDTYKDSQVYISSIPVRENTRCNNKAVQVNHYMYQRLPESIILIDNKDLTVDNQEIDEHLPGDS